MKKLTKNIINAIEDATFGSRTLIEDVTDEGQSFAVEVVDDFYVLYWGEEALINIRVGTYMSLVAQIFEIYIKA